MVHRGQEGTEKKVNLVERGHLTTGGSMSEALDMRETISFGVGKTGNDTLTREETVIITNV